MAPRTLPIQGPERDRYKRVISAAFDLLWMQFEQDKDVAAGARAMVMVLLEESSRLREALRYWQAMQPDPPPEHGIAVVKAAKALGVKRARPQNGQPTRRKDILRARALLEIRRLEHREILGREDGD